MLGLFSEQTLKENDLFGKAIGEKKNERHHYPAMY
jgi:hypothetical protein